MKSWLLVGAFLLHGTGVSLAWGDRGHSIIADIAMHHLTGSARIAVSDLLGLDSAAGMASWADDYKFLENGKHTYDWHFADIDIKYDSYDESRDCEGDNGCLVTALIDQIGVLGDKTKDLKERRQALWILIHLAGDSSQPFHCTERDHDLGGNKVKVDFEGKRPDGKLRAVPDTNLHAVWDDSLIDTRAYAWGNYAAELEANVVPQITDVAYGGDFAVAWVNTCHVVGKELYSRLPKPNGSGIVVLDETYQAAVKDVLDRQLAIGGLRLAAMLNGILEK